MAVAAPQTDPPKTKRKQKDIPGITRPMTYEEYLASPEEMRRYDIIDGWKVYRKYGTKQLTNPTRDHQRVQFRIARRMGAFEETQRAGQMILAPCDVLVRSNPTRTRQPDLLFISNERLAQNQPSDDPAPLSPAPELVVEILSPPETRRMQSRKLTDYAAADVRECWLVSLEAETVEVLKNVNGQWQTAATYGHGETVTSVTFPSLTFAVDDIFPANE